MPQFMWFFDPKFISVDMEVAPCGTV
jgi:hypothetical protein